MSKVRLVAVCMVLSLLSVNSVDAEVVGEGDDSPPTTKARDRAFDEDQSEEGKSPVAWPLAALIILPLVSSVAFHFWLRRQKQLDHDQKLKSWDIFFKMIATVTLIVSGMIAVGKYLEDRNRYLAQSIRQHDREIQQREHELNMRLFNETSNVYGEFLDVTAKLTFGDKFDEELVRQFHQLYHGRLMMVENVEVAKLAREFKTRLDGWQVSEPDHQRLSMLSLQLAAECRNHLQLFEVASGLPARSGKSEEVLKQTRETFRD